MRRWRKRDETIKMKLKRDRQAQRKGEGKLEEDVKSGEKERENLLPVFLNPIIRMCKNVINAPLSRNRLCIEQIIKNAWKEFFPYIHKNLLA